ncbi:MAG: transglycosylase domain-containing protein, partial [Burkholderiaceae bacterium]
MIRAALRLLVVFGVVWFLSLHWEGAFAFTQGGLRLVSAQLAPVPGALHGMAVFGLVALAWTLVQLPLWICTVRVDRFRGPRRHPFARLALRRHLQFRPRRFISLLILQLLGLLLVLRALPLVFEPGATEVPAWMSIAQQLSDRDTWIFYGIIHLVAILVGWTGLLVIAEIFAGRSRNPYGFYRYQFEHAPVSRMLVRLIAFGVFPVAAFAATSHAHAMHATVVIAWLVAMIVVALLAQVITLIGESRNEAWLRQLDRGYAGNEAVASLREHSIRFLHPGLAVVPAPTDTDHEGLGAESAGAVDPWSKPGSTSAPGLPQSFPQAIGDIRSSTDTGVDPANDDEEERSSGDTTGRAGGWRHWLFGMRPWMAGLAIVIAASVLSFAYQWMILPSGQETRMLAQSAHIHVRRSDGEPFELTLLGTRYDYSLNTGIENVSQHFIDAVIASEDHRFLEHGVIYKLSKFGQAALRCVWRAANPFAQSGGCRGNSTIGQQLARNLFISEERSLLRKFKELVWSIKMEFSLSKQEILEAYLNRIYLGKGNFGVEMASRSYFGKSALQLNLHESALLAAAVKRPTWNLQQDKAGAIARAKTIMLVMRRYGFAPPSAQFPDDFVPRPGSRPLRKPYLGHLWQWIKPRVEHVMASVPAGDYKLLTTLNAEVQVYARRRLSDTIRSMQAQGVEVSQGAVVVMRPNGEVLAMVGGIGDDVGGRGVNRAKRTDGLFARPPASAFKPLVYLAALENGLSPDSVIAAGPVQI